MNQTPALDIWKGNNRISLLWADLLANCVSPDPVVEAKPFFEVVLPAAESEPSLLERAGFESLRLIRHALEILTAPPEEEPEPITAGELGPQILPARQAGMDITPAHDPMQEYSDLGLTFIKVSSEPDPQPGSAIDTRRIAYGLKIPARPLHKRPIYQRIFFCLHHMMNRAGDPASHS